MAYVRHPADRLLSAWSNRVQIFGFRKSLHIWGRSHQPLPDFPALVDLVRRTADEHLDKHVAPQSLMIEAAPGGCPEVVSDLDWLPELEGRERRNASEHGSWQNLQPELIQAIEARYSEDVRLYARALQGRDRK